MMYGVRLSGGTMLYTACASAGLLSALGPLDKYDVGHDFVMTWPF